MRDTRSFGILLHGLRTVLLLMQPGNPNRYHLGEALRHAEKSRNRALLARESAAELRIAAAHLRRCEMADERSVENEVLAATRRAMTAVLFQCTSGLLAEHEEPLEEHHIGTEVESSFDPSPSVRRADGQADADRDARA
jgi:hypothetical protein